MKEKIVILFLLIKSNRHLKKKINFCTTSVNIDDDSKGTVMQNEKALKNLLLTCFKIILKMLHSNYL